MMPAIFSHSWKLILLSLSVSHSSKISSKWLTSLVSICPSVSKKKPPRFRRDGQFEQLGEVKRRRIVGEGGGGAERRTVEASPMA